MNLGLTWPFRKSAPVTPQPVRFFAATKDENRRASDKKRATTEALRRVVVEQRLLRAVAQAVGGESVK